ncbi:MAG TPA: V-type ATP synthase subunit E family protein [Methanocorpusculum sp.]|nr:V-type ATP synthase subunit E family protein [Methanocorpusculum sp.]HJJ26568.1 V-type ATP synthase subunit E family protein [Methanocorpusculum sp.]
MGLEAVVDEIKRKGDAKAAAVKAEADSQAKTIVSEANLRAQEIKLNAEKDAAVLAERIEVREVASANLVVKRDLLNAQKELLEKVYAGAEDAIAQLPAKTSEKAIKELLKEAAGQIKKGEVFANAKDQKAVEAALELKTLSGFTFGGAIDILGGVIVKSADGQITLDYSYKTFMNDVWESSLKDASEILFG